MERPRSKYLLPFVLLLAAIGAWSAVILMAAHVSQIILNTLDQIVKLAQLG